MASQNLFLVQQSSFSMAAIPSSHLHKGRNHPLFLCCRRRDLHDRRNVVSLSASAAAARDPPFPAVIVSSPSSKIRTTATRFGLRTTVTQFCARQGPIAGAADADPPLNSGLPVPVHPEFPARVAVFAWRTVASAILAPLCTEPGMDALVFLPLFRRCGVPPSLLPAALNWKFLFLILVSLVSFQLDVRDMWRCEQEWCEYSEKLWQGLQEVAHAKFAVMKREAAARERIRSGTCKPDAGQDANPEFQG